MNKPPFIHRPGARISFQPPTLTPVADTDVHASSTLDAGAETRPQNTVYVQPRAAADTVDLPDMEPAVERSLRADDPGNSALDPAMLPGAGPDRTSFFTTFMETFATDSSKVIDAELFAKLNTWLAELITLHTTAETSLRDFGAATTERGAQIDMRFKDLEKLLHQVVWMKHKRELLKLLGLDAYVDAIMAREIATEFGSALDVEREVALAKQREKDNTNYLMDMLERITKSLSVIQNNSVAKPAATQSVFRQPRKQRPPQPLPPAPAPDQHPGD